MATFDVMGQRSREDEESKRRSFAGRRRMKGSAESSTTTTSSSGQQKKKKLPQRGMGVEKLEKLRVQENWKKMAHHHHPTTAALDPIPIFGAPAYLGFQYDLFGGFAKHLSHPNATTIHPPPLLKSYSGHCLSCHKKKKINAGGDSGFLGFNSVGEYQNVIGQENFHQGLMFGTNMPPQGHTEIVAVHMKGPSSAAAQGVMMEYEFFPSTCSSSKCDSEDDELVMMNFAETHSSSSSSMPPGFNLRAGSSTCVDLSLKLSY